MKLASVTYKNADIVAAAARDRELVDVNRLLPASTPLKDMLEVIRGGAPLLQRLGAALANARAGSSACRESRSPTSRGTRRCVNPARSAPWR